MKSPKISDKDIMSKSSEKAKKVTLFDNKKEKRYRGPCKKL